MADPRVILDGERFVLDRLSEFYPGPSPVIFDVGANVGDYAREVLARIPDARLWCFEPTPDALSDLLRWSDTRAEVVPMALSNVAGKMTLRATDTHCCYLAGLYRDHDGPSGLPVNRPIEVTATTLDDYCNAVGIEQIHLLKIDVEGHEPWVLDGAQATLARGGIDLIQFEMADVARNAGWTFRSIWEKLTSYGFDLFLEHPDELEPIGADAPLDDLEHYVNVLALSEPFSWEI